MHDRAKATLHRKEAIRLNVAWEVGAVQPRYSDTGHWYARLSRFPAALFDRNGYLYFKTQEDFLQSRHLKISKQVSVPKPGICAVPGYVRKVAAETRLDDVDIHEFEALEGREKLVLHLTRERSASIVNKKKRLAKSRHCEVCGFSFEQFYGEVASSYCEVHHLVPLAELGEFSSTNLRQLAILCSNCHRVVHLRNPPFTLEEMRSLIGSRSPWHPRPGAEASDASHRAFGLGSPWPCPR